MFPKKYANFRDPWVFYLAENTHELRTQASWYSVSNKKANIFLKKHLKFRNDL